MPRGGRGPKTARRSKGPAPAGFLELGRIVGLHGVRGEVRMLPHNPDSTLVTQLSNVTLDDPEGPSRRRRVVGARRHKRFVLLRFEGLETVEQARSLVGRAVSIPLEELPPAGPSEVYHVHLVGCRVETDRGVELGVVEEVLSTPSTDSCVVRGRCGEVLVPLVADVIVRIDVERRSIVVRALPGLLDA